MIDGMQRKKGAGSRLCLSLILFLEAGGKQSNLVGSQVRASDDSTPFDGLNTDFSRTQRLKEHLLASS